MRQVRFLFLIFVALASSGYKFRCWWMCQDQTSVQNDYIEQRDHCREYAQLKLDMAMRTSGQHSNDQNRKAMLVTLFGDCMASNGWNVSDKKDAPSKPGQPTSVNNTANSSVDAADIAAQNRAALSRSAECAFARQSASVSSLAATRAKACDLECAERLKAAPDAPRPAACPAGGELGMEKGAERTY